MSDLKPLRESDAAATEGELLRSARLDVPPAHAKRTALVALGISGALIAKTAPAATLASSSSLGLKGGVLSSTIGAKSAALVTVQWLAVGIAAGGLTVGGAQYLPSVTKASAPLVAQSTKTSSVAQSTSPRIARLDQQARELPGAPIASAGQEPDRTQPAGDERRTAIEPVARATDPPALREPTSRSSSSPLSAEVLALARARSSLSQGRAQEALSALDAYAREFTSPVLMPEAQVLRLQALLALGRMIEAHRLGEQLLRSDPSGPHAPRVRSLLSRTASGSTNP